MGKITKDELTHILRTSNVENTTDSDNLATILVDYFEDHIDRPRDDEQHEETGWGQWSMKKAMESADHIAEQILNKLEK